jgi:predicted Zn-dependent protease
MSLHRGLRLKVTLSALGLATTIVACSTSPLGRQQLHFFFSSLVRELGEDAFSQLRRATPRLDDPELSTYVACVTSEITMPLDSVAWEVVVFDQESVNAFALPGRKSGIYRGMFGMIESQDQLATVITHEVAHIARFPSAHRRKPSAHET